MGICPSLAISEEVKPKDQNGFKWTSSQNVILLETWVAKMENHCFACVSSFGFEVSKRATKREVGGCCLIFSFVTICGVTFGDVIMNPSAPQCVVLKT